MGRAFSLFPVLVVLSAAFWACENGPAPAKGDGPGAALTVEQRCEAAIDKMSACYPEITMDSDCSEDTLATFAANGLAETSCEDMYAIGKADVFAFDGCDAGFHRCGLIFCCRDDYDITWFPVNEEDWDIVALVRAYQAEAPVDKRTKVFEASKEKLRKGVSASFVQHVQEYAGEDPKEMGVELTVALADVPYDAFREVLPAADWGIRLAHYLGGEISDLPLGPPRQRAGRRLHPAPRAPADARDDLHRLCPRRSQLRRGTRELVVW